MSQDGASLGIPADQALETVLGGKPQPKGKTDEEFAAYIRSAPEEPSSEFDYGEASRWLAGRYLTLLKSGVSPQAD